MVVIFLVTYLIGVMLYFEFHANRVDFSEFDDEGLDRDLFKLTSVLARVGASLLWPIGLFYIILKEVKNA